jgi:hypothetical protein
MSYYLPYDSIFILIIIRISLKIESKRNDSRYEKCLLKRIEDKKIWELPKDKESIKKNRNDNIKIMIIER